MEKYNWLKLDTPSIMFTSLTTRTWGRTFRFSAILKEDIDPVYLERSAKDLMPFFPNAYSCLRKGFFWNYLEVCDTMPEIREEYSKPLMPITFMYDGRPQFRIVYYKKRIAIECAHSMGDGKGVLRFFSEFIKRYLYLRDGGTDAYSYKYGIDEITENAFGRYYLKDGEKKKEKEVKAFHLEEKFEKDYLRMIFALMTVDSVKKCAHNRNMTVTEFMSAVLILGIIRSQDKGINEPVTIGIPVNLRRFFPTQTLRNFVIEASVTFEPKGRKDITLDEICEKTKGQLKKQLEKSELQKSINKFGALSSNPVLKIVPNAVKLPVLRVLQKKTHKNLTTIFTNWGDCDLPDELYGRVERLNFVNGDTRNYGLASTCSCISTNGILNLCFSVANRDTRWQKECIGILLEEGITDIQLESTDSIDFGDIKHENRFSFNPYRNGENEETLPIEPIKKKSGHNREKLEAFFYTDI